MIDEKLIEQGLLRPKDSVVACELDSGSALLDLNTSEYIKLNVTAALVWEWLTDGATLDAMAERMSAKFDVSPQDCRGDIIALVGQFAEASLVEERTV